MEFRQPLGRSVGQVLTKVPCRGKVSIDTFPDFGRGVVGRDNVPESPDREQSVCPRGYLASVGGCVEIEVTTGMLSLPPGIRHIPTELTGSEVLPPKPGKRRCSP